MYESPSFLAAAVADYLAAGIAVGQPVLVIATLANREAFARSLRDRFVNLEDLVEGRDYLFLDAEATLGQIQAEGTIDPARFDTVVAGAITRLIGERQYVIVRAYGEMVDLLVRRGQPDCAVALEDCWNTLGLTRPLDLLCSYDIAGFQSEDQQAHFARICERHERVLPTESYLQADERERLREIARLQQRARALETEVRRRRELEAHLEDTLQQRRAIEGELRRRETELRDFVENGLEPMHWVAADGTILWANRAELDLLGYARDEVIGRHVSALHADAAVIADILARLSRGEELRNIRARLRRKDGSLREVLINSNVYWQDGKFMHTRCFTRDVTGLTFPVS